MAAPSHSPSSPRASVEGGRVCMEGAFLGAHHERNERRTWIVVGVASVMMVAEIVGGSLYGSMALAADGWHMSTHAGAMTVAALAYRFARTRASDPRFAFGTGKVGELAGFASAVVLGVIAILIAWESVLRLFNPRGIRFDEAIGIAVIGLLVNLVSAWLLHQGDHADEGDDRDHDHAHDDDHEHGHEHDHDHDHDDHDDHDDHAAGGHHGHHHDNNLRAAYLHVVADALTSVLAIAGLLAGRFLGWVWMDPMIGVVGGLVIAHWSWSLMKAAGGSLLDVSANPKLPGVIRARLERDGDVVTDLHVWRLGPGHQALVASVRSSTGATPDALKARLAGLPGLSHVTVEVNHAAGDGKL